MIPVLFPLLTCIMSTENLLNWTNLVLQWMEFSDRSLSSHGQAIWEPIRNLLSVCGLQDHQLRKPQALFLIYSHLGMALPENTKPESTYSGALSPGSSDHLSNVYPGWTVPSLIEYVPKWATIQLIRFQRADTITFQPCLLHHWIGRDWAGTQMF